MWIPEEVYRGSQPYRDTYRDPQTMPVESTGSPDLTGIPVDIDGRSPTPLRSPWGSLWGVCRGPI